MILMKICCIVFGMASWIACVGVWVELPLLVNVMPEGWALASKMSLILQSANVVPLIITIIKTKKPKWLNYRKMIYGLLFVGCLTPGLLSIFWNFQIGGNSVPFYILFYMMSIVDCASSVTFTPFMSTIESRFLSHYFIGEGFSGFIPAILGSIQGAGDIECTDGHAVYLKPRFTIEVFFICIFGMTFCSLVAFTCINNVGRLHIHFTHYKEDNDVSKADEILQDELIKHTKRPSSTLFIMLMISCFLSNGFLPSIVTFYMLPYGQNAFHLGTILATFSNPLAAALLLLIPLKKPAQHTLFWLSMTLAGWMIWIAFNSPCPIMVDSLAGTIMIVTCFTFFTFFVTLVKVSIANDLRNFQNKSKYLLWYGAITQLGSFLGAISVYPLVHFNMFTPRWACSACPTVSYGQYDSALLSLNPTESPWNQTTTL